VDYISVSVAYPEAPPSDVEKGICLKIEDHVRGMAGVEEIDSESREGLGTVYLKLSAGAEAAVL